MNYFGRQLLARNRWLNLDFFFYWKELWLFLSHLLAGFHIGSERGRAKQELFFITIAVHFHSITQRLIKPSSAELCVQSNNFPIEILGLYFFNPYELMLFAPLPVYSISVFYSKNEHTHKFQQFPPKIKKNTHNLFLWLIDAFMQCPLSFTSCPVSSLADMTWTNTFILC